MLPIRALLRGEHLQRLIHIEGKVDRLLAGKTFSGHADQAFGHLTYAQFGEDLIIANIFSMLGIQQPSYLDVGAHHPINISNTALFYLTGSRGVNVEANPNCVDEFRRHRPEDVNLNVGVGPTRGTLDFYYIDDWSGRNTFDRKAAEEFVAANPLFKISKIEKISVVSLNDIVAQHMAGKWPDFLSIDIEGMDFDVIESAHFGTDAPTVICVEAISGGGSDVSKPLADLLRSRRYSPFCRTVGNVIFVRNEALTKLN